MRSLTHHLYTLMIRFHFFANRRQVRTAGSLLYVASAVAATVFRHPVRSFGRAALQLAPPLQLKALVTLGLSGIGQALQRAEAFFH